MPRLLFVFAFVLIAACSGKPPENSHLDPTPAEKPVASVAVGEDSFAPVKLVLSQTCAPCHNPGGKMYERLPFDQSEVVREHYSAIVGRLSAENRLILEKWFNEDGGVSHEN